jgi:hypothetical protein
MTLDALPGEEAAAGSSSSSGAQAAAAPQQQQEEEEEEGEGEEQQLAALAEEVAAMMEATEAVEAAAQALEGEEGGAAEDQQYLTHVLGRWGEGGGGGGLGIRGGRVDRRKGGGGEGYVVQRGGLGEGAATGLADGGRLHVYSKGGSAGGCSARAQEQEQCPLNCTAAGVVACALHGVCGGGLDQVNSYCFLLLRLIAGCCLLPAC